MKFLVPVHSNWYYKQLIFYLINDIAFSTGTIDGLPTDTIDHFCTSALGLTFVNESLITTVIRS
jgi:hypothetical protein